MLRQYPALFPHGMDQGFTLHDAYASVKQDLIMRQIKLIPTGAVFTLRPSCVMPSMIARTDAVEKALSLRQWGDRLTPWPPSLAAPPSRGLRPKERLRLQPHPSYAACPGRALSRAAGCGSLPLRAGAAAIAASEGAEACGWVAA
jgi:hypothetical protein